MSATDIFQPQSLAIATNAQHDAEHYTAFPTQLVTPYIQTFTANLQESQKHIAMFMTPALEWVMQFQEKMRVVTEERTRFDTAMKAVLTPLVIPSQDEWVLSPIYPDIDTVDQTPTTVKLPEGSQWDDIELRFKDLHTLSILHKNKHVQDCDYAELGFARKNTRDGKPDKQWGLLLKLSIIIEQHGVPRPTTENLSRELRVTKGALQKNKEILAKKLSIAFGILGDPFQHYDAQHGYQPRFKLRPEALLRGNGELHRSGGQYFDELIAETPEKY